MGTRLIDEKKRYSNARNVNGHSIEGFISFRIYFIQSETLGSINNN